MGPTFGERFREPGWLLDKGNEAKEETQEDRETHRADEAIRENQKRYYALQQREKKRRKQRPRSMDSKHREQEKI